MTDNYTPSGWGTGVIADPSDGRPDAGNHYKSWNRWRQDEDHTPPAAARVAEDAQAEAVEESRSEDVDSPPAGHDEVSPEPTSDEGYVPMRRSNNTKRRGHKRGGGRHRLNERGGPKGSRSRKTRRKEKKQASMVRWCSAYATTFANMASPASCSGCQVASTRR